MTDQSVGGISVPLTIDRSGWSAQLKAARGELEAFKREVAGVGAPTAGGRSIRGGGISAATPITGIPQSQLQPVAGVSPRFAVSAGAVRDLRIDINRQMRQFAAQGEAVLIPVKLGRVPYGQMRNEISQGIGEVPIRVTLDPTSIAAIRGQIMRAATVGAPGAGGPVSAPRRAMGGPVFARASGGRVTEGDYGRWLAGSMFQQQAKGRLRPVPGEIDVAMRGISNLQGLLRLSGRNQQMSAAGRNWYTEQQQIHKFEQRAKALGVTLRQFTDTIAILSSGAQWYARKEDAFSAAGVRRPVAGPNITAAEEVIRHIKKGAPLKSAVVTGDMVSDARRYFSGTPMSHANFGPKRAEFAASFHDPRRFVIDRWQGRATTLGMKSGTRFPGGMGADVNLDELEDMMARAVKGKDWTSADAPGPAHRRASVFAGQRVADMLGIEPRGVQAESWTEMKRLEGVGNQRYTLTKSGLLVPKRRASGGRVGPLNDEQVLALSPYKHIEDIYSKPGDPALGPKHGPSTRTGLKGKPRGVRFHVNPNRWGIQVEAERGGHPVGVAEFERSLQSGYDSLPQGVYYPAHSMVDPRERGKGIGSWMYAEAEKHLGEFIHPSDVQSGYAKRMWSDPSRPFGGDPETVRGQMGMFWPARRWPHRADGGDVETLMGRAMHERGYETLKARRRGPFEVGPGFIRMYGGRPLEREDAIMGTRDVQTSRGVFGVDPLDLGPWQRRSWNRNAAGGWVHREAGGPVTRSLEWMDPNGLHMRPAAALAKVGMMAQLSGNPIRVNKEGTKASISGIAAGSVLGWSALGVRQGQRLSIEVGGTEPDRVVKLLEALIGFKGPEATGKSYSEFHGSIGVSNQMARDIEARRRAGGGPVAGQYIVNELGREKFVPARMQHMIPDDVMAQIPQRESGGIVEIPGHGARLWEAPEDGWIIPARLASRVPLRHQGGPAEAGHSHPHRNRQGTGFQDEYGRPVPDNMIVGRQPVQDTWRGAIFGSRQMGPSQPRSFIGDFIGTQQGREQARNELLGMLGIGPSARPDPQAGPGQSVSPGGIIIPNTVQRPPEDILDIRGQTNALIARSRANRLSLRENLPENDPERIDPLQILQQEARVSQAAVRGLTGRAGAGGLFGAILGGGQARREAMIRGSGLLRAYERMRPSDTPPGTDTVFAWGEELARLEDDGKDLAKQLIEVRKAGAGAADQLPKLTAEIEANTRAQGTAQDIIKKATSTRIDAEKQFEKAQGGAVRNIAALTAAGFAFTTASQAVSVALELGVQAAKPFVDQITGFESTATRVTQGLSQQARQLGGNIPAAVAGAAGPAGVGGQGLQFLTQTLAPSIAAKAGAAAAQEASDLFRAAAGTRGPQGLFGGFGGVGGGPLLAEFIGGGKGFTEVLAGDVSALRTQQQGLTGINALRGPNNVGTGADPIGDFFFGTANGQGPWQDLLFGPERQRSTEAETRALQVLTTELKDYNEAVQRGADALGEHTTGLRLATREQLGLTDATDDLAQEQMRRIGEAAGDAENAKRLAESGVFLVDAAGNLAKGTADYQKFFQQAATGRTIQTPEAFVAQQARQLRAQRELSARQRQFTSEVEIPGALGQQLAAQPFTSAFAGIPGLEQASAGLVANLTETQRLQDEVTKEARLGIELQARTVDMFAGGAAGREFRQNMAGVTAIGEEIASISEAISNRQSQVSFMAYSNNIRILNRSIADARGLLSGQGGSLGALQRQQFDLSRQSQKLSLESQRLQLQSNQLQLQLSQRQINFQTAVAGFQAPGITGQERAARMAEAELEASFAQRQLDIAKQQQGIGGQQLGIAGEQFALEMQTFLEGARRSLVDLEAQRAVTKAQFELEQEQIAAQRRVAVLTVKQAQLQQRALAIFGEATGNFNAELQASAQYVAAFGGTAAAAAKVIRAALSTRPAATNSGSPGAYYPGNQTPHASGYNQYVDRPTSFIAGDAGGEQVLVIRNPTAGVMGPAGGWGGGGGMMIQISVSGNTFGPGMDAQEIVRELADEIEDRFATKARLLGVTAS